jgi:hypothetical protein
MLEYIQTCMRKCGKATDRTLKKVLDAFDLKPEEILEYMATFIQKLNEDNALECGLEHAVEKAGEQIVEDAVRGAIKWTLGEVYARYVTPFVLPDIVDKALKTGTGSRVGLRVQATSPDVGLIQPKCCDLKKEQDKFDNNGFNGKSNAVAVREKLCQFTMIRKADGDTFLTLNLPNSFTYDQNKNDYGLMMYMGGNRLYGQGYLKGRPLGLIPKLKVAGISGKWNAAEYNGLGHFTVVATIDLNKTKPNPGYWTVGENPNQEPRIASDSRYTENHDNMWGIKIVGNATRAIHHLIADNVWRETPMLQEVLLRCNYHMDKGELLIELANSEANLVTALSNPVNAGLIAPVIHDSSHSNYDAYSLERLKVYAGSQGLSSNWISQNFSDVRCSEMIAVIQAVTRNINRVPNFVALQQEFMQAKFDVINGQIDPLINTSPYKTLR